MLLCKDKNVGTLRKSNSGLPNGCRHIVKQIARSSYREEMNISVTLTEEKQTKPETFRTLYSRCVAKLGQLNGR